MFMDLFLFWKICGDKKKNMFLLKEPHRKYPLESPEWPFENIVEPRPALIDPTHVWQITKDIPKPLD